MLANTVGTLMSENVVVRQNTHAVLESLSLISSAGGTTVPTGCWRRSRRACPSTLASMRPRSALLGKLGSMIRSPILEQVQERMSAW